MAGTFQEEYDALSARIGVAYDAAQAKGATAPMPAARDTYGLSTYIKSILSYRHVSDYVQSGLILCWDGIENAGVGVHASSLTSVYDHSGNSYNGTMVSATPFNNYFYLHGPAARIYNGAAPKILDALSATEMTVEVLAQKIDWDSDERYALWNAGNNMAQNCRAYQATVYMPHYVKWKSTNVAAATGPATSAVCIQRGQMNTIAHVGEPHSLTQYRDGIQRKYDSLTADTPNGNLSAYMTVGGRGSNSSYAIVNMNVYCFRVYNRALTSAEIAYNRAVDEARFNIQTQISAQA